MTEFARSWTAEVLKAAPLIAPARQYVWPVTIAGEEDALARGALQLMVRPALGGAYLVTCALGFTAASMPTGVFGCPNPDEICAVAGGYAYVADTNMPECPTKIGLKPVVEVRAAGLSAGEGLLLFIGFHKIVAWGVDGLAWETERLSWEGIRVVKVGEQVLRGFGWDLVADRELEFTVDLRTGEHTGGGFTG